MIGRPTRNGALPDSGTPSPNPWDLPLSRQNDWITLETLERRIGLRRDATRAPIPGPEWHGAALQSRPKHSTPRPRRTLTYCGQKMVLTMGSTIPRADCQTAQRALADGPGGSGQVGAAVEPANGCLVTLVTLRRWPNLKRIHSGKSKPPSPHRRARFGKPFR